MVPEWYKWSIKAPLTRDLGDRTDSEPRRAKCRSSLSLVSTSPSWPGTLPSPVPEANESDVFVPESQFYRPESRAVLSTPHTDSTVEYLEHLHFRQRRPRTVDRMSTDRGLLSPQSRPKPAAVSPVRQVEPTTRLWSDGMPCESAAEMMAVDEQSTTSPRRLFATSPNLISSTPHVNKSINAFGGTQVLFDTPEDAPLNSPLDGHGALKELVDGREDTRYSGHVPVFLPASFEQIDTLNGFEDSSQPTSPPCKPPVSLAATVSLSASRRPSLKPVRPPSSMFFRSILPAPFEEPEHEPAAKKARKRVSFASLSNALPVSSPEPPRSTGSLLSSIDNGKLAKRHTERDKLKVLTTPVQKFAVPCPDVGMGKPSDQADSRRRTMVAKRKHFETQDEESQSPAGSASRAGTGGPLSEQGADLTDVVWCRWKPDRPQLFVLADLLDRAGSSRRSMWRARLHSEKTTSTASITLGDGDYLECSPVEYEVRLTKGPVNEVFAIDSWALPRIVVLRRKDGSTFTAHTKHLILHSLPDSQQGEGEAEAEGRLLLDGMSFLTTCGSDRREQTRKNAISRLVRQHGGACLTLFPDSCSNLVLISVDIKRTFKFLLAIVRKVPRVTPQWLTDSIEQNRLLPYADYSIEGDLGQPLGPRPEVSGEEPLKGQLWCLTGPARFKQEFGQILRELGATVVAEARLELVESRGRASLRQSVQWTAEQLSDCIITRDFSPLLSSAT